MAEVKKKVKTDWNATLNCMEVGDILIDKLKEKDSALRCAHHLKTTNMGIWSVSSNKNDGTITITRTV